MCSELNENRWSVRMTSPLTVTPAATASSRAKRTSRPLLLLPSPDTSIVRRSASKGACANWAKAKSIPPLMDVLLAKERGISSN